MDVSANLLRGGCVNPKNATAIGGNPSNMCLHRQKCERRSDEMDEKQETEEIPPKSPIDAEPGEGPRTKGGSTLGMTMQLQRITVLSDKTPRGMSSRNRDGADIRPKSGDSYRSRGPSMAAEKNRTGTCLNR